MSAFPADMDQFNVRQFLERIIDTETGKADDLQCEADGLRTEANFIENKADEHRERIAQIEAALANIDDRTEARLLQRIAKTDIRPDAAMQDLLDRSKGLPFGTELADLNERYQELASLRLLEVVTEELPEVLLS